MKKTVIIAGITGQDGTILANQLKKKGINVIGLSRKKVKKTFVKIEKTDYSFKSIKKIVDKYRPIEIYNFAGVSVPSKSWNQIKETFNSILFITLNFLEVIRLKKKIKFFNASSSEIFKDTTSKINENSKIFPNNPYGIAKASTLFLSNAYRIKYKLFIVNGIFFNHVSKRKTYTYLFNYIAKKIEDLKKKKIKKIIINDSRIIRDFGDASDFMKISQKLMKKKIPEDYIIATGKSYSVKEVIDKFLKKSNLKQNIVSFKNKTNFKFLHRKKYASIKKLKISLKNLNFKILDKIILEIINK